MLIHSWQAGVFISQWILLCSLGTVVKMYDGAATLFALEISLASLDGRGYAYAWRGIKSVFIHPRVTGVHTYFPRWKLKKRQSVHNLGTYCIARGPAAVRARARGKGLFRRIRNIRTRQADASCRGKFRKIIRDSVRLAP